MPSLFPLSSGLWFGTSVLAMGMAIWWMTRHPSARRGCMLYVITAFYLLFSAAYAVAYRLTGKGIDVSVIYHLQTGLRGTGWTIADMVASQCGVPLLSLPLLFQIDGKDRVSSVAYPGGRSLAELVLELPATQSMVWIDQCPLLQGLNGQETKSGGYCMAIGQAGMRWQLTPIEPQQAMDYLAISQSMALSRTQSAGPALQEARPRLVHNWTHWGSLVIDQVLRVKGLQQPLFLRSSGHPSSTSVANVQTSSDFHLRGLTLVRIAPDGQVEKVVHKDTCAQQPAEAVAQAHVQTMDSLARLKPQTGKGALAHTNKS